MEEINYLSVAKSLLDKINSRNVFEENNPTVKEMEISEVLFIELNKLVESFTFVDENLNYEGKYCLFYRTGKDKYSEDLFFF